MQLNSCLNMEQEWMWKLECVGQAPISTIAKNVDDIPEAASTKLMLHPINFNVLFTMPLMVTK